MKSVTGRPTYSAATASLLRRTAAKIKLAVITPEALPDLPESIGLVLDTVVAGFMSGDREEQITSTCAAERDRILAMTTRIYNLLPLYLGAVATEERTYFTLLIAHNLADLAAYYSVVLGKMDRRNMEVRQPEMMYD